MTEAEQELELRFLKLMQISTLKTIELVHPDVDAQATVRQHMLTICAGVRQRALDTAPDGTSSEQATQNVDALIHTINEYFDYAASPMFPPVELVKR